MSQQMHFRQYDSSIKVTTKLFQPRLTFQEMSQYNNNNNNNNHNNNNGHDIAPNIKQL